MAQLITVRLTRNDGQPWGFRLQGGKDFGSPLALQKVNVGSIADKAGLLAGDALIKVNGEELFNLRHKDAQDALVRAGSSFELVVSRGGSTWRPSVTPLTSPVPSSGVNLVTKTSLQAKPGQNPAAIGTGHNTAAKPFSSNGVKSIVNKQYNTPVAMYSDETIAETLSAQTEVLAGGVLGVNFKKNEKVYNSAQSEVFKMLQEQDHEPEPARPSSLYSPSSHFAPHHQSHEQPSVAPVTQHVTAPVNVPKPPSNNGLPPGQNICADCERLIVGVFVRIKDKNLHVECFKCSTCGTSLKNQGYYNLNNKLYCDIHARLAALSSPPPNSNGMVPVTVPPKAPTSTISSALSAHANAFNGSNAAPVVPTTAHCISAVDIVLSSPTHSRTSSVSSGYGNSNSSLKNSPIIQSPSHSRQSSGVSLNDLKLIDNLDGIIEKFPPKDPVTHVSDDEKEDFSGNLYYKTINGGIIRSVKPPNKNNGEVKYKLPSSISGPKPFSYAPSSNFGPTSPPQAVSAPKSPIAYPPPAAPAWTAPVSAPAPAPAPAWAPPPNEALKAPAAQSLQESKMLLLSYIREEEGRPEVLKGYEEEISRSNTPAFHWPPKPPSEEEDKVPLAAPIYVPPPETQHIQPKPRTEKSLLPPSAQRTIDKQSISAPELALVQSDASMSEQPEMYSDNSASTSTSTGDSSSEEYQVYSTNVSQQVVRYYDEPKPNPINAAVNYASNYAAMLRHKPSICSVASGGYVDDMSYDNGRLAEVEEAYMVREPSEPRYVPEQYQEEFNQKKSMKRVGFAVPAEEVQEEREGSLSRELRRRSPVTVEGRHGPVYPNTLQIQQDLDSYYYDQRRESDEYGSQYEDIDRRQSYESYSDSRRESEINPPVEDKTIPFVQQYCTGDTRFALQKLEETKPCPLPISPNVNSLPQQWQSQMLKALTITPKEVEKDMDDPFERARQAAYEKQIEDDRKARDNERRKLMDEMLAKQRAMRERQERNEQDLARKFAPVSKLAPRTPDNWRPPQPTPPIPLPEEKEAYIPPPPTMEPIRIGPLTFPNHRESPLLDALKTAPIRPYTPFSSEVASQLYDMPKPSQPMSFSSALVTAPDRPFTPHNELRDYNASPVPYTPAPDYSQMPTKIYKENEEQIRYLEEEVEQRLSRRNSAFAQIRPVKPATPVEHRRKRSNGPAQMDFPFTDDQIPEMPRPIVCVPQECLSTYQSMCSVQQRAYNAEENQRQNERMQQQQQQQQQRRVSQNPPRQAQIQTKSSQLPPPHPSARVPLSPRRVQSQAQSPALLKPDPAGLHKADDIPGYQRKWFNLPSQRASITPEPHELKENVPLAFVAAPKEPSPTISKPIAISAANTYTTSYANLSSSQSNTYSNSQIQIQQRQAVPPVTRKLLAIEPRYSITESQTSTGEQEPQVVVEQQQQQEEPKQVTVAVEDKTVGNPTTMLEQSVRDLKINTTKTPRFRNEASQVISAMLEARLKQKQTSSPPPLPKCSPPKFDPVPPSSDTEKQTEILSIIPQNSDVKRNSINNNKKMHATNRLSYVEKNTNQTINNNNNDEKSISQSEKSDVIDGLKNGKTPICNKCNVTIMTGPFITALGRIWCPEHFICVNGNCKRPLADIGFVEEKGDLYCEYCFEQYLAPNCSKCTRKIKGDCLNAIGKQFHPECFTCSHCGKLFGNSPFFLEEGEPFCQNDWNQLFTTKCFACGFPVEAGDRWVEALNNNYHSQCFNCTMCKKNLEGQSFYAKGGRPFCKNHAR